MRDTGVGRPDRDHWTLRCWGEPDPWRGALRSLRRHDRGQTRPSTPARRTAGWLGSHFARIATRLAGLYVGAF
jgi:hypothetical protein